MSKLGNMDNTPTKKNRVLKVVRDSYIYKFIKRILSILCTILLVLLLAMGAIMFYFNMQAKAAQKKGIDYTAPFGLYTIVSGSMEPNIHVFDVVGTMKVDDLSTIKVGDIITFVSDWDVTYGKTVTHRVVTISKTQLGEYQFSTKGDANQAADGSYVTNKNLVGRVIFRVPQLGRLQFFLATKIGWFVVVFIPAMFVIVTDIIRILKLKVIQNNITDIKSSSDADKIYFENEILDNREIGEVELDKTMNLPEANEGFIDESLEKKTIHKKPLARREKPEEVKEDTIKEEKVILEVIDEQPKNEEIVTGTNPQNRKPLMARKKSVIPKSINK